MADAESLEQEYTKCLLPFLARADEIDSINPKVAYYCRMYAVDMVRMVFGFFRLSKWVSPFQVVRSLALRYCSYVGFGFDCYSVIFAVICWASRVLALRTEAPRSTVCSVLWW
jgi:Vta1 like